MALVKSSFFSLKIREGQNGNGQENFWNVPNLITSSRIISAIISSILLYLGIWLTFTYFLKLFEAVSDLADGWVARRFNCETKFGAKFDPVADKIVVSTSAAFIILVSLGFLAYLNKPYPKINVDNLIILIYLDGLLFLMGVLASQFGLQVKSNVAGKAKMICECIFINFWFLSYLAPLEISFKLEIASLWSNRLISISIVFATCSIALHLAKYLVDYQKSKHLLGILKIWQSILGCYFQKKIHSFS